MKNQRVLPLLFLLIFLKCSIGIYDPDDQQYHKPVYTSGIKTSSSYVRPSDVQVHHNYSRVYHQNYDGPSRYEGQESFRRQYPVYNAHTYGNRPQSERLTQVYVLNGTRIRKDENPVRRIVIYNKEKRTPSIQVYKTCPHNATGQFVYESSCNQFLNCWKGRGFVQNCAPGTLFNPKTLECDFPHKVDCVTGPRRNIVDVEKSHSSVKQVGCPKEFSGLIPNYTDCSKFINCVSGIENFMDCPAGTLFDIDKNICDFAHKANCFNGQNEKLKEQKVDGKLDFGSTKCESCSKKPPQGLSYRSGGEIKCPQGADGLHKHPTDCSKFLNCANGLTYIQDCAPGTLFNPLLKICDFPYNVRCQSGGDTGTRREGSWQGHTDIPVYVPSSHHSGGDRDGWGRDYDTTATYGYGSSTTRPYGYGGSTSYDTHRNVPKKDQYPTSTTGTYYNNQGSSRVTPVIPIYHRPIQETDGTYGSGSTHYRQPVEVNAGTTYGHQPANYGYDRTQQNVYGNTQGHSSSSQFSDNNRNNWAQNQYDSYDEWSQRPADTYHNRPQDRYNQPTNQYDENRNYWNQHQYGQSTGSTGSTYGQNNWGSYAGTGGYDHSYSNNYKNDGKYGIYNGTYRQNSLPMNSYHQESSTYDRNNNQGSRDTYGQNNWPLNNYHQGTGSYDRNTNQNIKNGSKGGYAQSTWPLQGSNSYDRNDHRYGTYNGSSTTYGQGTWPTSNYQPESSSYDRNNDQNFSNNYNRNGHRYGTYNGSSTTYGHGTWPTNNYHHGSNNFDRTGRQNFSSNYNRNDGRYGTYDGSSTTYNQRPRNSYDGSGPEYAGGTVVNQRGESGYNRAYDQHPTSGRQPWWYHQQTHETMTPNYDHVVNINRVQVTTPYRKPYEPFYGTTGRSVDYEDTVGVRSVGTTTARIQEKSWPPPFPSTDVNADYVFEYEDNVSLEAENSITDEGRPKGECGKGEFRCSMSSCVSKTLVCNGAKDCPNGEDELRCLEYVSKFSVKKEHKLAVLEKERWDNVSIAACALLCIETRKFQCRSFNYRKVDKTCFLGDSNEGLSGALIAYYPFDYYELTSERVDCSKMYVCNNKKCIDRGRLCDGKDDCGDRMDEKGCQPKDFGYKVRLTGSNDSNQGQIEVTAFGKTGYVCDDNFDIRDADVVCRELGFEMGAVEVKKNSYFAKNSTVKDPFYMMDDVTCSGNETKLMDCDFSGWGVHNCLEQEIVGVVCKTPQDKCADNYWQCDSGHECLPLAFVCDGLLDCTDGSDEKSRYCDAFTEIRLVNGSSRQQGRVEIKHHGIWGTICDDDFNEDAAKVICRQLGYKGSASVRKDAYFGAGTGPIWLDQVFCSGNESNIESCTHWDWGEHNCEHSEDVGVVCSNIYEHERHSVVSVPKIPQTYPFRCGYRKDNIFNRDDDVHFRVVKGSVAKKGDYPWQAAIRVKEKTNKAVSHWCGAVIISERFVLTAAHCLMGYSKGAYVVVAGDYDVDEDEGTEQEVYIEDFYIHEKFRQGHKMNNDIALVKLKGRGFRFNDDVQPICLPENGTDYETNQLNCTVSGFGSVRSGRSAFSHQLRAGWIPIQKKEICKMPHVYGEAITEGMICAGSLSEGVDACDGDSGGPLACLNDGVFTLYGITSWGQHCGYANKPGVYVKVAYYRQWIDDNFHKYSI